MAHEQLPPAPVPRPVIRPSEPATTGATVCVACKMPGGLLLRCFEKEEYMEPTMGGILKKTEVWRAIPGKQFAVRGTWTSSAGQAYAKNNPAVAELLPGGYALTHSVPKDIWDQWYDQNKMTAIVKNKIIFACPSLTAATDEAKELRAVKSGLEPINQENPAERMPGGASRADRAIKLDMLPRSEVPSG